MKTIYVDLENVIEENNEKCVKIIVNALKQINKSKDQKWFLETLQQFDFEEEFK